MSNAEQWQPIETAPAGERVLLFDAASDTEFWKIQTGEVDADGFVRFDMYDDRRLASDPPDPATHWMPLPQPPGAAQPPEAEQPQNVAGSEMERTTHGVVVPRELLERAANEIEGAAVQIDGEWGMGKNFEELCADKDPSALLAMELRALLQGEG